MFSHAMALSICCLFGMANNSAFAAEPKHVALLIGNWDYNGNNRFDREREEDALPDLVTPCHDIDLIESKLKKHRFDTSAKFCNISKNKMTEKVLAFGERVQDLPEGSIIFVYYSGHGLQAYGNAFLAPVDMRLDLQSLKQKMSNDQVNALKDTAFDVRDLLSQLPNKPNVASVVALDNCRDNPLIRSLARNIDQNLRRSSGRSRGFSETNTVPAPPRVMLYYATKVGDTASDGQGNSPFAKAVAEQLEVGNELGIVMTRAANYVANNFGQYPESSVGSPFPEKLVLDTPLSNNTSDALPIPLTSTLASLPINSIKVRTDIFYCEGQNQDMQRQRAVELARTLNQTGTQIGVGQVRIRPLAISKNEENGYRIRRNIIRYDAEEIELAYKVAAQSTMPLIPSRGTQGTPNYLSVFFCP